MIADPPLLGELAVIWHKDDLQLKFLHPIYMGLAKMRLGVAEYELVESWFEADSEYFLFHDLDLGSTDGTAVRLARERWWHQGPQGSSVR